MGDAYFLSRGDGMGRWLKKVRVPLLEALLDFGYCAFVKPTNRTQQDQNIRLSGSPSNPFVLNWLYQTEMCLALWNLLPTAAGIGPANVEPNVLVIWQGYVGDTSTSSGHVGIVTSIADSLCPLLRGTPAT